MSNFFGFVLKLTGQFFVSELEAQLDSTHDEFDSFEDVFECWCQPY